jgi:hypothetical protein
MNGTTSTERTNYFETLPSNYLPLAFWLESDRMRSLKVTQENLDNQRHAVQERKRLRYDNQPYVTAFLRMNELIFANPANCAFDNRLDGRSRRRNDRRRERVFPYLLRAEQRRAHSRR